MSADGPVSDWTTEVISFLSSNLPVIHEFPVRSTAEGWDHMFSTAYQIGCAALVALGQADDTEWGALPREHPRLPGILPRWDDICVSVLWLAEQQGKLQYRLPDGSVPQPKMGKTQTFYVRRNGWQPPAPNIAAGLRIGLAHATPDTVRVLAALGLIAGEQWLPVAETVLWRDQPRAWALDVESDPRFADAVAQACDTMPNDIRREIDRLISISDADVAVMMARAAEGYREQRARYGPKARIVSSSETPEGARKALEFVRGGELDFVFFRRWRLSDGWLSPKAAERALAIFHDPLAMAVRRAVIAQLYPDVHFLFDELRPR